MRLSPFAFVVSLGVAFSTYAQAPSLSVEIRCEKAEVRVGDAIPIVFVIRNTGTDTYEYIDRNYDRSGRMPEYVLEARDERAAPVADPRTLSRVPQGYIGGGIGGFGTLIPGAHFEKTIVLNEWAFITAPGLYSVSGTYSTDGGTSFRSPPVVVRVLPRSADEMSAHIDALVTQLRAAADSNERVRLIRLLMYTADRRVVGPLLDAADNESNVGFYVGEAFSYYLPRDGDVRDAVVAAVRRRGLSSSSGRLLTQLDVPADIVKDLIGQSLRNENPEARAAAAMEAQSHPDDDFMAALIDISTTGRGPERVRAVYALACNRTDAGVAALRRLMRDQDPGIRVAARRAVESALERWAGPGRPFRADDFPEAAVSTPGGWHGNAPMPLVVPAWTLDAARLPLLDVAVALLNLPVTVGIEIREADVTPLQARPVQPRAEALVRLGELLAAFHTHHPAYRMMIRDAALVIRPKEHPWLALDNRFQPSPGARVAGMDESQRRVFASVFPGIDESMATASGRAGAGSGRPVIIALNEMMSQTPGRTWVVTTRVDGENVRVTRIGTIDATGALVLTEIR